MAGKPLLLTAESEDKVALQVFQFTPLCWERHAMPESDVPDSPFQSTPPCAGGDHASVTTGLMISISIHAPLCGGRQGGDVVKNYYEGFQSTPPVRGATRAFEDDIKMLKFQSTPPCAGGDDKIATSAYMQRQFQSTPPCAGGDVQYR